MIFYAIQSGNRAIERPLYVAKDGQSWTSDATQARRFIYTRTAHEHLYTLRAQGMGIGAKIIRIEKESNGRSTNPR